MPAAVLGLHHVTAIASEPQPNLDFYCGALGLRLVKRTVNFDDPGSYHLYYGDAAGRPGTLLTFFAWPGARRGQAGTGQAVACAFSVPRGSLPAWRARLDGLGIAHADAPERLGDDVLAMDDPDGMRVELVASVDGGGDAVSSLHSVTLALHEPSVTAQLLTEDMGLHATGASGERFRFEAGEGGHARTVDLAGSPAGTRGRMGPGAIHHVAFRLADEARQLEWHAHLAAVEAGVSPVMDRCYFHSIYFREPGGVLFELATDPPGFAVDEPIDALGRTLCLPPWLESARPQIERALPPITVPARRDT